jgi:hypothetical protein
MKLTKRNYEKGFLLDDEFMAGVSPDPSESECFLAFILNHLTGEYLFYQSYPNADMALSALRKIPRTWEFQPTSACGGDCASGEGCKGICSKICKK